MGVLAFSLVGVGEELGDDWQQGYDGNDSETTTERGKEAVERGRGNGRHTDFRKHYDKTQCSMSFAIATYRKAEDICVFANFLPKCLYITKKRIIFGAEFSP